MVDRKVRTRGRGAAVKPTHTPGPWHVCVRPGPMVYGPLGEQIADMRADLLPHEERIANMCLISAAPALLEALDKAQRCMDRFAAFLATERQGAIALDLARLASECRAAIVSARGTVQP